MRLSNFKTCTDEKEKFVRANLVHYLTKALRKAIMKRSELKSKYLTNRNQQNMNNFRNQRIFYSRSYKKEKKKVYIINEITDNKAFWKTTTRLLSSKAPRSLRITLIENEAIISDDQKVAKTFSSFFEEAVDKLDIM